MKPTFQNSRPSRQSEARGPLNRQINKSPATDWSFQTSASVWRGGGAQLHPGAKTSRIGPAFHTLSQGFFRSEANRESRLEGVLFGIIVAIAAWPMALAMQAAFTAIR